MPWNARSLRFNFPFDGLELTTALIYNLYNIYKPTVTVLPFPVYYIIVHKYKNFK